MLSGINQLQMNTSGMIPFTKLYSNFNRNRKQDGGFQELWAVKMENPSVNIEFDVFRR